MHIEMSRMASGRSRGCVSVQSALGVICLAAVLAACTYSGIYFAPSAASGRVDYPPTQSASYGLEPKNYIYFSPPGQEDIQVIVRVSRMIGDQARAVQIEVSRNPARLRSSATPSQTAPTEMPVVLDPGDIEIDWSNGKKQTVPVAFDTQNGLTFILHRYPGESAYASALVAHMSIPLDENPSDQFAVTIPAMTFEGHRLEFPIITFRRVDTSK